MSNHISEREWLEFTGDATAPAEAVRIRSHLEACPECAHLFDQLTNWQDLLTTEGARLRHALELPAADIDTLVDTTMERILSAPHPPISAPRGRTATERQFLLRSLIEPIFGSGTARLAMDLAVRRCTTHSDGQILGDDWPLFVRNLSDTLASIGGIAAGKLVRRAGDSLAVEGA